MRPVMRCLPVCVLRSSLLPSAGGSKVGQFLTARGRSHPRRTPERSKAATHIRGGAVPSSMDTSIELTETESKIFETLLHATKQSGLNTTLRCAGGWVRDKLLGRQSDDIDIALDNMMGKDFAEKVNEYLRSTGQETHSVGVIQCNPEQSKHLETARMKVCGVWLDLVNLRSETYTENSRIPEMQFGTAEQDALRRDFTINSMFYNINSGSIEDLTDRGLQDLRDGIIRTPLEPLETFTDDPLRVLRGIRFASRYNFELEEALVHAASSDKVREELIAKVSRERVGAELDGMLNGPDPVQAIRLIFQLRLFPAVFLPPQPQLDLLGPGFGEPCLATMEHAAQMMTRIDCQVKMNAEDRRLFLLASLLLPLRGIEIPKGAVKGIKQPTPLTAYLVRDALKRRNKDADALPIIYKEASEMLKVWYELKGGADLPAASRTALGHSVRRLKELWEVGVLLAPLLLVQSAMPLGVDRPGLDELPHEPSSGSSIQEHVECANWLRETIFACKLEQAWAWKPLIDGKTLMSELGVPGGPQLGKALAQVMDWQLANPDGTLEDCKKMLQETIQK